MLSFFGDPPQIPRFRVANEVNVFAKERLGTSCLLSIRCKSIDSRDKMIGVSSHNQSN